MSSTPGRFQIRIHPTLLLYLILLWCTDGFAMVLSILITLLLHEAAHLIAGYICHDSYESLTFAPFGGIITTRSGTSSAKGILGSLIAAAGPAANYAAVFVLSKCFPPDGFLMDLKISLIKTNAAMLCINLLPVLPLDGGRIVFSAGYYLFSIVPLLAILAFLGRMTGILFVLLSVYGAYSFGKLNFSLLIIGVYIMICAKTEHAALLSDNRYAVLHEKLNKSANTTPVQLYLVNREERLYDLFDYLCKSSTGLYLVMQARRMFLINENDLIHAVLNDPHQSISDMLYTHEHINQTI